MGHVTFTDEGNRADKIKTANGLVLKCVADIESVRSSDATILPVRLGSWQICRLVRRDYYLLCSRFDRRWKKEKERETLSMLLCDLEVEADRLEHFAAPFAKPSDVEHTEINLKIISLEAKAIWDALYKADGAIQRFCAHEDMRMVVSENLMPFNLTFSRLKRFAVEGK
jgi:hypothetical protein